MEHKKTNIIKDFQQLPEHIVEAWLSETILHLINDNKLQVFIDWLAEDLHLNLMRYDFNSFTKTHQFIKKYEES